MKGLNAKLLIGNDILGPEGFTIDVKKKSAHIASCNASIELSIRPRGAYLRKKVRTSQALMLQPGEKQTIEVAMDLPQDRDFIFEPAKHANFTLFSHVVDCNTTQILVRNDSPQPVQIPRRFRVGHVSELNYENCYQVTDPDLAMRPASGANGWFKKAFTATTMLSTAFTDISPMKPNTPVPAHSDVISKVPFQRAVPAFPSLQVAVSNDPSRYETCLPNGVSLYGNNEEIREYTRLVDEFPSLWIDDGFIDVPKEQWMTIPLKENWQSKVSSKSKIYPLGRDDRAVVDSVFDKMQEQGRLVYRNGPTPFSFPEFVVWRTVNGERKGRPVIDIRGLNDLTVPDAYPIPLQEEVISDLRDCTHISVLDANSFFYQWRVHTKDTYKLTVISHRGQETFLVPVMGYKNSVAYVQRQMDNILREYRAFVKAYIDDVVVRSKSMNDHIQHLRQVFTLFVEKGISIKPTKVFLGYSDVNLLGQHVNALGLSTSEEKLRAISQLKFPRTLSELEHYLGFTGFLRSYIYYYAGVSRPLQDLKTLLLKASPKEGRQRKTYSSKTKISGTDAEIAAFNTLQSLLSRPCILVHFNPNRTLWIDVDASKEFGFGVIFSMSKKVSRSPKGNGLHGRAYSQSCF